MDQSLPARDERGRILKGHTANPHGRPAGRHRDLVDRLVSAARAEGATVVVLLPRTRPPVADPDHTPPRAA
jgi:hypothetical protein